MDSSPNDINFNFVRFIKFLQDNNVVSVIIAAILSDRINEMTNTFFDDIILPIINRDSDGDNISDIKKFEDYSVSVLGAKLNVGKVILAIFKFLIVAYILFISYNITNKYNRFIYG